MYATRRLDLFYNSAKYNQNIPLGIPVIEQTRNLFQTLSNITKGYNAKVIKVELSLLYATRRLVLFYISNKYHKNISKGL